MLIVLKYTILSGDSYTRISTDLAKCTGITYQQIASFNHISDPGKIKVGEVLKIPDTSGQDTHFRYTVRPGNTLSEIADGIDKAAGVTVEDIQKANPQISPANLQVGQVIALPSKESQLSTIGYWARTWDTSDAPTPGATMGLAFSGWADPAIAIADSKQTKASLKGAEFIGIGGGNANGKYTADVLAQINSKLHGANFAGYQGIAFDIEIGDANLQQDFKSAFSLAKSLDYQVIVSVSHSAPYDIDNGNPNESNALMKSILADPNVDIISPMLYSSGHESGNDYTPTNGTPWTDYQNTQAAIMPSILDPDWYADAESYFRTHFNITLKGYIIWPRSS